MAAVTEAYKKCCNQQITNILLQNVVWVSDAAPRGMGECGKISLEDMGQSFRS